MRSHQLLLSAFPFSPVASATMTHEIRDIRPSCNWVLPTIHHLHSVSTCSLPLATQEPFDRSRVARDAPLSAEYQRQVGGHNMCNMSLSQRHTIPRRCCVHRPSRRPTTANHTGPTSTRLFFAQVEPRHMLPFPPRSRRAPGLARAHSRCCRYGQLLRYATTTRMPRVSVPTCSTPTVY